MLKIPKRSLFSTVIYSQPAAAGLDDDTSNELLQAIVDDPSRQDDNWELEDRPDSGVLEQFWNKVEDDIHTDPTWFHFSNDEE